MNKFKFCFSFLFYLITSAAYSAEYGIGAGVSDNISYIYFPINFDGYRVEPMLNYINLNYSDHSNFYYYGMGIGLFKVLPHSSNTKIYFRINADDE